jgi:hypothetical protein
VRIYNEERLDLEHAMIENYKIIFI